MGDLAIETAVQGGDGHYTGKVDRAWEIWGPMGGYIASFALRAVGAEARFARPASFFCHYLGVAEFEEVDIEVTPLRSGRTAEAFRASITQKGRAILEATVWTIGEVEGLVHDLAEPPDAAGPEGVPTMEELLPDEEPVYPFWLNFDVKPVDFVRDWPPTTPMDPVWREWLRFRPTSTFDDPWVDACRSLILVDIVSWPAASRHHAWQQPAMIAPSLDLYVAFHHPAPDEPWLLADGHAPVAGDGLIGWTGRVWSSSRQLVASGGGQLLCRPTQP